MRTSAAVERSFRCHLGSLPAVLHALNEAHAAAWEFTDHELLDLCRLRIAMLLGHADTLREAPPDLLEAVRQWPSAARFGAAERACLEFTEQFVIDVASIEDDTVAAVADALGEQGLVDFVNALLVVEQRIRLDLMWRRLVPEVTS